MNKVIEQLEQLPERSLITGLIDDLHKNQYLNAVSICIDLLSECLYKYNKILKGQK